MIIKKHPEEYHIFRGMHARCENKNSQSYRNYGARGIFVDKRWCGKNGFKHFLSDMGPRPADKDSHGRALYSIERIDNDGPYSPKNCKWATIAEQANNRRNSVRLTIGEETKTAKEWAEISGTPTKRIWERLSNGWSPADAVWKPRQRRNHAELNALADTAGLSRRAVRNRIEKYGWSVEDALTVPITKNVSPQDPKFQIEFNGKTQSIRGWSEDTGIPFQTLKARILRRKWSIEDALTTPVNGRQPVYSLNGKTQPLGDWAKEYGLPYRLLQQRITRDGLTLGEAIKKPVTHSRAGVMTSVEAAKVVVEYYGKKYTIPQLAKMANLRPALIRERIFVQGWSVKDAVETPPNGRSKTYEYKGATHTIPEWARLYGIPVERLRQRVNKLGKSIEEAIKMG